MGEEILDVEEARVRILSRYVLRQFIPPAVLSLTAAVAIFVVIDLTDRLSGFLDRDTEIGTICSYYVYYIPYIFVLVLPMSLLLASLFCMGGLARYRELTAMKATGISLYRIVLPIPALALLVSIGAVFLADQVVPRANRRRSEIDRRGYEAERLSGLLGVRSKVALLDRDGQILSVGEYHPAQQQGKEITLDRLGSTISERIMAEEMRWDGSRWLFLKGDVRRFEGGRQTYARFESMAPAGLTIRPEDLVREIRPVEQMTGAELRAFIRRKARHGAETQREEVGLHLRLAFPFASFVIVFLGVPVFSRTRRSDKAVQFGVCLFISFIYYGCIKLGQAMGLNGLLTPFLGAWGANLLFLAVGTGMLLREHK